MTPDSIPPRPILPGSSTVTVTGPAGPPHQPYVRTFADVVREAQEKKQRRLRKLAKQSRKRNRP